MDTKQRNALTDADFAVPAKRALPITDETHVRMAWDMLDYTKGLSDPERAEARRRILRKAEEMGINTDGWKAHKSARLDMQPAAERDGGLMAMRFEAMALDVPAVPDHPNRVPFSGVLTRVDQASDNPVGGAQGKRVLIPKDVADKALASLLGMGVDYEPTLSGHDPHKKIGIMTTATIVGDAVQIEGFLYGADFPLVVKEIQDKKAELGFSYEAQVAVNDWKADPIEVTECIFTGAAILYKNKAAYTSTTLSAAADITMEIDQMDMQELMAAIEAAVKKATDPLAADVAQLKASTGRIEASSVLHKVKPHADRIRAAAEELEKDGMGGHEKRGHVAHLRRMADKMEAEAVMGKLPHIWNDHDWLDASTEKSDEVAALKTEIASLKAAAFAAASAPDRKTASGSDVPSTKAALAAGSTTDYRKIDTDLKASGASTHRRLTELVMARAGISG